MKHPDEINEEMHHPHITHRSELWRLLLDNLGPVAEVGVAEGRYAQQMLGWPIIIPKLYLVDRWQSWPTQKGDASNPQSWHDKNYKEVLERVAPHKDRVHILRGDSARMAEQVEDASLALVYIDADHSFNGVMRDICAWHRKVRLGGFMCWHDYLNPNYGVKRAVENFFEDHTRINIIPEDKVEDAGAWVQL